MNQVKNKGTADIARVTHDFSSPTEQHENMNYLNEVDGSCPIY
jgi:hypothetical protein